MNLDTLKGKTCCGGLDHSDTLDITALSLWFPDDPDDPAEWSKSGVLLNYFWCPEVRIRDRAAADKVPYDQWAVAGAITATEGDVVDFGVMWRKLEWAANEFALASLRVDPWNATATLNHCQTVGIPARKFRQGIFTLSEPSKQFEAAILQKQIRHDGNPVMRWMVSNVRAKEDASGNIRPVKPPRRSRKRIDGIVSAIMARAEPDEEERANMVPKQSGMIIL